MKIITKNKRAFFDYEFSKYYDAGIVLKGHEVKSIKSGNINIKDAIANIKNREIFILNIDIPLYKRASYLLSPNYEPKGRRKLLLNKSEIGKISGLLDKAGNVVIPTEVYLSKNGLVKIKLGIGKKKKNIEKKQILKENEIKRQMQKDIKNMSI